MRNGYQSTISPFQLNGGATPSPGERVIQSSIGGALQSRTFVQPFSDKLTYQQDHGYQVNQQ